VKHFVVSGCSFTQNGRNAWSHHFEELLKIKYNSKDYQFHNVAISAIGNDLISFNCLKTVQSLLDSGVKNKDIKVILQWSGLNRPTTYLNYDFPEGMMVDFQEVSSQYFNIKNDNGYKFIHPAGRVKFNNYWETFFKNYFIPSEAFRHTLDCMLKTQWFLKTVNVDYRMFTAWDVFTTTDKNSKNILERLFKTGDKTNQFADEPYSNKKNKLYKDVFSHISHMWDMIDWDNFWLFESNKVKCGGMIQWVQKNVFRKEWYVSEKDKHPSGVAAGKFANDIILPLVNGEKI